MSSIARSAASRACCSARVRSSAAGSDDVPSRRSSMAWSAAARAAWRPARSVEPGMPLSARSSSAAPRACFASSSALVRSAESAGFRKASIASWAARRASCNALSCCAESGSAPAPSDTIGAAGRVGCSGVWPAAPNEDPGEEDPGEEEPPTGSHPNPSPNPNPSPGHRRAPASRRRLRSPSPGHRRAPASRRRLRSPTRCPTPESPHRRSPRQLPVAPPVPAPGPAPASDPAADRGPNHRCRSRHPARWPSAPLEWPRWPCLRRPVGPDHRWRSQTSSRNRSRTIRRGAAARPGARTGARTRTRT